LSSDANGIAGSVWYLEIRIHAFKTGARKLNRDRRSYGFDGINEYLLCFHTAKRSGK